MVADDVAAARGGPRVSDYWLALWIYVLEHEVIRYKEGRDEALTKGLL